MLRGDGRRRVSNKLWLSLLVSLLLAALLIPIGWLWAARTLGVPVVPSTGDTGLLTTIGGVMGAVFTTGGLIVALVAVLTQLTLADRAQHFMEQRFKALLPGVLDDAERRIEARLLWHDAQARLAAGNWEEAEELTQQALERHPDLAGPRMTFGLTLSERVRTHFLRQHDWIRAHASIGAQIQGAIGNVPSLAVHESNPVPVTEAIAWLEAALDHNDGPAAQLWEALALMYGVNQRFRKMRRAIADAIIHDETERRRWHDSGRLPLLVFACEDQPDRLGSFQTLGAALGQTLPQPAELVRSAIEQLDPSTDCVDWWVTGTPWTWWQPTTTFPAVVRIFLRIEGGGRTGAARYQDGDKVVTLPEASDQGAKYLPIQDLVKQLGDRFLFVCRVSDREASAHVNL